MKQFGKQVYGVVALLFISGALWLVFHYFVRVEGMFGPVPHPFEPWLMKLHGLLAMLALILFGWYWGMHIQRWWKTGRSRKTGFLMVAVAGVLISTGYLLYYAGDETLRQWAGYIHWGLGLATPLLLFCHVSQKIRQTRDIEPQKIKPGKKITPERA
ncbi:hypothetical protein [Luteithermobacter gelatinilyticus]|uniref:hypothetical protein n=1 Tax=Luteithermobacter gelatinilyticus TaxID=2582913 RepID=UPI00110664FD|nr:hypothetical protein [Luteithermobacter gelatinilyticus]